MNNVKLTEEEITELDRARQMVISRELLDEKLKDLIAAARHGVRCKDINPKVYKLCVESLQNLYNEIYQRHYGRMPEAVAAAMEQARITLNACKSGNIHQELLNELNAFSEESTYY